MAVSSINSNNTIKAMVVHLKASMAVVVITKATEVKAKAKV